MYKLQNNPILLPHQIKILELFFGSEFAKPFFLTGGTALSAFYYAHRESKDLDLFTLEPFNLHLLNETIGFITTETGSKINIKVASNTYQEIYLENNKENWVQRIDIVHEQPKQHGELINIDGIKVDSLINIATNKITALLGRLEPKDYIDLYVILQKSDLKFDRLFKLAREKDLGLHEFYFANSISQVGDIKVWPPLKIPFEIPEIVKFYEKLAKDVYTRVKPE